MHLIVYRVSVIHDHCTRIDFGELLASPDGSEFFGGFGLKMSELISISVIRNGKRQVHMAADCERSTEFLNYWELSSVNWLQIQFRNRRPGLPFLFKYWMKLGWAVKLYCLAGIADAAR